MGSRFGPQTERRTTSSAPFVLDEVRTAAYVLAYVRRASRSTVPPYLRCVALRWRVLALSKRLDER